MPLGVGNQISTDEPSIWVDARWTTGDARGLWPAFGAFGGPCEEAVTC